MLIKQYNHPTPPSAREHQLKWTQDDDWSTIVDMIFVNGDRCQRGYMMLTDDNNRNENGGDRMAFVVVPGGREQGHANLLYDFPQIAFFGRIQVFSQRFFKRE